MSFNKENDVWNVVYSSDNNFAEILGISILSLFKNNTTCKDIKLHILDSSISVGNKNKINDLCKNYNFSTPNWIPAKDISEELKMEVSLDRGSLSQYGRLFVATLLPNDIKKIIYLDCDVIVNNSIEELWNIDLEGNTIGALMDAFSKYYRMNINLEPEDVMFNSGVMLIDMEKWKENMIEKKLLQFIISKNGKIQQGDQGALNAVLSKSTLCLHPKYNVITNFSDLSYSEMIAYRQPLKYYSEEDIAEALNNPIIIHYTSSFFSQRPWEEGSKTKYKDLWWKYKKTSPWKNTNFNSNSPNVVKKITLRLFDIIPKRIFLSAFGILQAYVRPIKNKISDGLM